MLVTEATGLPVGDYRNHLNLDIGFIQLIQGADKHIGIKVVPAANACFG